MKIYVTTEAERGKKQGKGANDFVESTYSIGSSEDSSVIGHVRLERVGNVYTLTLYNQNAEPVTTLKRTKGVHVHDWDNYGKCVDCKLWDKR